MSIAPKKRRVPASPSDETALLVERPISAVPSATSAKHGISSSLRPLLMGHGARGTGHGAWGMGDGGLGVGRGRVSVSEQRSGRMRSSRPI